MVDEGFRADLDELLDVMRRLRATHDSLEHLAAQLDQRLAAMHVHWNGVAAGAHIEAQARWDGGFAVMRAALAQMRSAAEGAHDHYARAADTNVTMWRGLG